MTSATQSEAVRFDVTVGVPVEHAFRVFTEQFGDIKPREHNLLGVEEVVETVFETRVGGHVYDRGESGTVCRWARVLVFEPPRRFVISWDISPTWQLETDLSHASEVEVSFVAETSDRTRVELEHRHLERHGEGWESVRDGVADPGGWPLYLQRYVDAIG